MRIAVFGEDEAVRYPMSPHELGLIACRRQGRGTLRANPCPVNRISASAAMSALLLGAIASPVSGGTVGEPVERVLMLRAEFDVEKKGPGFTTYILAAERRTDLATGEAHLEEAFIYRSQCEGAPADVPKTCHSDGGGRGTLRRFDVSDDFEEARLSLTYRGRRSQIRFTSTDRPLPYPDLFANTCGTLGFRSFTDLRSGEAEGRVMGQRVSRSQTSRHIAAPTVLEDSICV